MIYLLFLVTLETGRCPRASSGCGTWASHHSGISGCRTRVLGCVGFSSCCMWVNSCGSQAHLELCLLGSAAPRHVGSSRIGDEPVSPALACRFLSTGLPGKPLKSAFALAPEWKKWVSQWINCCFLPLIVWPKAVLPWGWASRRCSQLVVNNTNLSAFSFYSWTKNRFKKNPFCL